MHFTTYTKLHQLLFLGAETETPTYEQPLPGVLTDASSDYTLMTKPGSDKVQRRMAGDSHKTLPKVDSD